MTAGADRVEGVVHPLPTAPLERRGPAPWTRRGQPRQPRCHDQGGSVLVSPAGQFLMSLDTPSRVRCAHASAESRQAAHSSGPKAPRPRRFSLLYLLFYLLGAAVFLCYLDESGTIGTSTGDTTHFVLAGVSIPIWHWRDADREVSQVLGSYGLADAELHTAWMLRKYLEQSRIPAFEQLGHADRRREVTVAETVSSRALGARPTTSVETAPASYTATLTPTCISLGMSAAKRCSMSPRRCRTGDSRACLLNA